MDKDEVMRDDLARDLAAARADLWARRDQMMDEYGDRLAALDKVEEDLAAGDLLPRAAEAQIRRILGGDRGALRARHAGRTQIGMRAATAQAFEASLPKAPPTKAATPTVLRASLAVARAIAQIDEQVSRTLIEPLQGEARGEGSLRLTILLDLRRGLMGFGESMPTDAVLVASIADFVEHAQAVLADLEAGGAKRFCRLLAHCRAVAAELSALGGDMQACKAQIAQTQMMLAAQEPDLKEVLKRALNTFAHLRRERAKLSPQTEPSLVDELL